jgi:glycosyltransferase involved in cell wall biosynthesis
LNKAIASSNADYLIFIDDDCLLHPAFVRRHLIMTAVVPMSEVPDAGQVRSARPTARGPARLPEASQHGALPRVASVGFNKYATRALRHRADAWPRRKRAAHGVVHHKVRDSLTTQLLSSEGADA